MRWCRSYELGPKLAQNQPNPMKGHTKVTAPQTFCRSLAFSSGFTAERGHCAARAQSRPDRRRAALPRTNPNYSRPCHAPGMILHARERRPPRESHHAFPEATLFFAPSCWPYSRWTSCMPRRRSAQNSLDATPSRQSSGAISSNSTNAICGTSPQTSSLEAQSGACLLYWKTAKLDAGPKVRPPTTLERERNLLPRSRKSSHVARAPESCHRRTQSHVPCRYVNVNVAHTAVTSPLVSASPSQ